MGAKDSKPSCISYEEAVKRGELPLLQQLYLPKINVQYLLILVALPSLTCSLMMINDDDDQTHHPLAADDVHICFLSHYLFIFIIFV